MIAHISINHFNVFFVAIVLFASSCNNISKKEYSAHHFFDASDYFNKTIKELSNRKIKLEKTVILNDTEEKKVIDTIDWKNELAIFINTNINKSAIYEYYTTDSILQDSTLKIVYQSKNEKMHTKQFEVYFDKSNIVKKINVLQTKNNLIFQSDTHFEYIPNTYYKIEKKQSLLWFASDDIIINARFL